MSAKKKDVVEETPVEAEEVIAPTAGKIVSRKILKDEIIDLQKEGRLVGYNSITGVGMVREKGLLTRWPGGNPVAE